MKIGSSMGELNERKLNKDELSKREEIIKDMKKNKRQLTKRYGKDAEKVMYGRATNLAKKQVENMDPRLKIREMVKAALSSNIQEEEKQPNPLSFVNKRRAKAEVKKFISGKRTDGMGAYDAIIIGIDKQGNQKQIKTMNQIDYFVKFALADPDYKIPTIKEEKECNCGGDCCSTKLNEEDKDTKKSRRQASKEKVDFLDQIAKKFEDDEDENEDWEGLAARSGASLEEMRKISYDKALEFRLEQKELKDRIAQLKADQEEEAEVGGGPIANMYGRELEKLEQRLAKITSQLDYYDLNESNKGEKTINEYDVFLPSQEEVDNFFEETQQELHYLYSKPVEEWDEYDYSNWLAKLRKKEQNRPQVSESNFSTLAEKLVKQIKKSK